MSLTPLRKASSSRLVKQFSVSFFFILKICRGEEIISGEKILVWDGPFEFLEFFGCWDLG